MSDEPNRRADFMPGITTPADWRKNWYLGAIAGSWLNLCPGIYMLFFEDHVHVIDDTIITLCILVDFLVLFNFAVENFSRRDVRADIVALVFSISSVGSAIILFATRYKELGIVDTLNDKLLVRDTWTSIYFSIVTWTTVGYGDFVPSRDVRFYASSEAIVAYFYMALLITQLLALGRAAASPARQR